MKPATGSAYVVQMSASTAEQASGVVAEAKELHRESSKTLSEAEFPV